MRGLVPRFGASDTRDSMTGRPIDRTVSDFHARVVQHEVDHLDGVLYPAASVTSGISASPPSSFRERKSRTRDGAISAADVSLEILDLVLLRRSRLHRSRSRSCR